MQTHTVVRMTRWYVVGLMLAGITLGACAGKDRPTVVASIANHGTTLMQTIKVTQQAVIDAEAQKIIPRNAAVASMETFREIGAKGEEVAKLLNVLLALPGNSPEVPTTIDRIQQALTLIQSQLFTALVPIGDEATRAQVGRLAAEVSKTILILNREILGGAR